MNRLFLISAVLISLPLLGISTSVRAEEIAAEGVDDKPASDSSVAADSSASSAGNAAGPGQTVKSPTDALAGHMGFGYFSRTGAQRTTPIGVRYWMSRDMAIDAAVDLAYSSGGLDGYRAGTDLGVVMALAHYHYSVVFARAGLRMRINDAVGQDSPIPPRYDIGINGILGAEMFLGALGFPNISVQAGVGLDARWEIEGGARFTVGTTSSDLNVVGSGVLGFHIYL